MVFWFIAGIQRAIQDFSDVIFSRCCVGCDRSGRLLCTNCRELIPIQPKQREAHHELWFGAPYESVIREMINAHKEHGVRALSQELGMVLARTVWAAASLCQFPRIEGHCEDEEGIRLLRLQRKQRRLFRIEVFLVK